MLPTDNVFDGTPSSEFLARGRRRVGGGKWSYQIHGGRVKTVGGCGRREISKEWRKLGMVEKLQNRR